MISPESPEPSPAVSGETEAAAPAPESTPKPIENKVREVGGRRDGTDPTRFGDWEKGGRCIDF